MSRRDIKVLFVEDDPNHVELMVYALKGSGFEPDHIRVDNLRDFNVAVRLDPAVIVCDYYLPDLCGVDVLNHVHECGLDIPVIVVSAALPSGSEEQIIRLGAVDYVRKDQLALLGKTILDAITNDEEPG